MSDERIAGLRCREAAARIVLRTAICGVMSPNVSEDWHRKQVVVGILGLLFADVGLFIKFIFGGCGGGAPKVRAAEDNAASRRKCSGCATLRVAAFHDCFIRYLLFGQKVTPTDARPRSIMLA